MTGWTAEELGDIDATPELLIATQRPDGTHRRPVPIWVVRVGEDVYVRTWYRRTTGWFGHVLRYPRAHVTVGRVESDVVVDDVGTGSPPLRSAVDAAYRAKYGAGHGSMVTDEAAATTLRLRTLS